MIVPNPNSFHRILRIENLRLMASPILAALAASSMRLSDFCDKRAGNPPYTNDHRLSFVMPGLVPGIHDLSQEPKQKTWMAGTSPAMTMSGIIVHDLSIIRRLPAAPP
jgi:hypothetical protein